MVAAASANFGLSPAIVNSLREVFARYSHIEQVVIFGSRAKDTARPASDIDIAVFGSTLSAQEFTQLWGELDSLPLVFKLDVVHWESLDNENLKKKILQEGKRVYPDFS
jgi:proline iminopeptidase